MVPNPMTARRIVRVPFGWCAVEPTGRLSVHVGEAQTLVRLAHYASQLRAGSM